MEKEKIRLNDSEIVEKGIKIEQRKSSKKEVSSNGRDSLKGIDKMSIYRYPFCTIGNSLESPITQKGTNVSMHILFHLIEKYLKFPAIQTAACILLLRCFFPA